MDENKLKHSYAVANKMMEIGANKNLDDKQLEDLFLLGFLHDIGYNFGNKENHNIIGGNILKNSNYKYWQEVYYHGVADSPYQSLYLDILNTADLMIDKYGNDVGFDKRLEDIKTRYGIKSVQYQNSIKIVEELRKRG